MPFQKELPTWLAVGNKPSDEKINNGWDAGEKPPADWFDWIQNRTYEALQELQNDAVHNERMVVVENDLQQSNTQPVTLSRGLQTITADQDTPLWMKKIVGRTVTNHVPLFDSGLWVALSGTWTDTPIKTTVSGGVYSRYITVPVKANTTYTLSLIHNGQVMVQNSSATLTIVAYSSGSTHTFNTGSETKISIYIRSTSSGTFTFENIMLNEGSTAQEFVDDVKGLQGAYAEVVGKNLLPPFTEWSLHANAKLVSPYELRLDATANYEDNILVIPSIPNQAYTLNLGGNGLVQISALDVNDVLISVVKSYNTTTTPTTFTTPGLTNKLEIRFSNRTSGAGTFTFVNPQLELGTTATPFEAQRKQYVSLPTTLHSLNGVSDEWADGKVTRRFKEVTLDGSLPWVYYGDYTGYKGVSVNLGTISSGSLTLEAVKYDGKILGKEATLTNGADKIHFPSSNLQQLRLTISDTDSGLGETWAGTTLAKATYTLLSRDATSSDVLKALMNGWKIINFGTPASTQWQGIVSGTTTADVDKVVNTLDAGYTPGKLIYQLSESEIEEIPLIGDAMLTEGNNSATVGEGLVQREAVVPKTNGGSFYYINLVANGTSLKSKADKILRIYKNEDVLEQAVISTDPSLYHGKQGAYISETNFDPIATYYVDYIAEPYAYSSSIATLDAEYSKNIRSTVDELVRSEAEHGQRISVIEQTYARKAQPGWIAFILLNGVTAYNATSFPLEFRKDEFGKVKIKGLFTGVSSGLTIGYLPKGYRPKNTELFTVATRSGTTYANAVISISVEGAVQFFGTPGTTYNSLHGIEFYAEQ